jgi:hypothetical protein
VDVRIPLLVELCAGTAALSLRLERSKARPPVSRMGSKAGYSDAILSRMGLHPGQGAEHYLLCEPDPGCRLLLEAYRNRALALAAAEHIRGWKDEEPRALWERLREEGPAKCAVDPREVARWARIVTANRLIPVHHDGKKWCNSARNTGTKGGISHGGPDFCTEIGPLAAGFASLPTLPATITDDARTVDPREVARWVIGGSWAYVQGVPFQGWCGPGDRRQDTTPKAIATKIATLPTLSATITDDARTVDPPQLPAGSWVYIDPPYVGTTGYGHNLGRPEVIALARRWREAGAHVAVSEAEPIAELIADGWHAHELSRERVGQKRTFSKQQREVLTISRAPRGQLGLL